MFQQYVSTHVNPSVPTDVVAGETLGINGFNWGALRLSPATVMVGNSALSTFFSTTVSPASAGTFIYAGPTCFLRKIAPGSGANTVVSTAGSVHLPDVAARSIFGVWYDYPTPLNSVNLLAADINLLPMPFVCSPDGVLSWEHAFSVPAPPIGSPNNRYFCLAFGGRFSGASLATGTISIRQVVEEVTSFQPYK